MGSIGTGEILLVLVVALIVLGPEKLPKAARQTGNLIGQLRRLTADVKNEVNAAINDVDINGPDETPTNKKHPGTEGFRLIDQQWADEQREVIPESPTSAGDSAAHFKDDDTPETSPKPKRDPLDPDGKGLRDSQ